MAQYQLVKQLIRTKIWNLFIHVDMGIDRLHHAFWRYHDSSHRLHDNSSLYRYAIRDYYHMIDSHIGEVLSLLDDDVIVLIVSDHGVIRMDGGICINEWLRENGWLVLKTPPIEGNNTRFEDTDIDWSKTMAWGAGGYHGRVFLNVVDREPWGVIHIEEYESVRDELARQIKGILAPDGLSLNTQVMRPEEIYTEVNNVAADLIVYFGDLHWLHWGVLGTVATTRLRTIPDQIMPIITLMASIFWLTPISMEPATQKDTS